MAIVSRNGEKNKERNGALNFTQWKQRAIEAMLRDDELMKLLYYNTEDWDTKPNLTEEQKFGLLKNQIFTYSFIDKIAQDKKSYIGMSLSHFAKDEGFRRFSNRYISGYLYFNVLVAIGIMDTTLGDRADLIIARLYDIFQDNKSVGMGEMKAETIIERWVDNGTHGGYVIGFSLTDLD